MLMNLSVRAKLAAVAVVATVGAVALAGFNLYAARASAQALSGVYETNVHRVVELQKIAATLGEVRFRVAGVLLDVMPVQGSLNHIVEARKDLEAEWKTVLAADAPAGEEERRLFGLMREGWGTVDATLGKIQKAYEAKNNDQLRDVLDTDWATLIVKYSKPLDKLLPLEEAAGRVAYERSSGMNRPLNAASVVLAGVLIALIAGVVLWVMRSITMSLGEAVDVARRVADGDLEAPITVDRHDEMGRLLQALAAMQAALRGIVGDVRTSAQRVSAASAEIARGTNDLARRTEEQASSLEETASSWRSSPEPSPRTRTTRARRTSSPRPLGRGAARRTGDGAGGADHGRHHAELAPHRRHRRA